MVLVATWNLQLGRRLPELLAAFDRLPRPELLAIQEASSHAGSSDGDTIARRLGPTYEAFQFTAQHLRGQPQANGLVWDRRRFELGRSRVLELPPPAGKMLSTLPPSRRSAVVVEGRLNGLSTRIHVIHLDVLGLTHKHAQFGRVLEDAARSKPVDLALIAGDLNTIGPARRAGWPRLRALAVERGFEEATADLEWTQRALGLRQKLDAIFVAPPGIACRAWTEVVGPSDHLPVFVELSVA